MKKSSVQVLLEDKALWPPVVQSLALCVDVFEHKVGPDSWDVPAVLGCGEAPGMHWMAPGRLSPT